MDPIREVGELSSIGISLVKGWLYGCIVEHVLISALPNVP